MHNLISISCLATLIIWCCFSLLLHSHPSISVHINNVTDRQALLAIKSQIHDPLGVTSSWNNSVNFCQWIGVTCGHKHQRIIKLDLANQNIGGFLSPYVGNLTFLKFIDLSNNSFHGEIPTEVGRLFRLKTLMLNNNSFSGRLPPNLSNCSNLIQFSAYINKLVGEIPVEISKLLKLENLSILENNLTGQVPASIGNISTLRSLVLNGNRLGGRIPNTLGQLRKLVYLNLGLNQFFGSIPHSIYNISSLVWIFFHGNSFNGILPLEIGLNLPDLQQIVIHENDFFGSIPNSFSNLSHLEVLDLSNNQFNGEVSIDFSILKNLSYLNLGTNNLGTRTSKGLDFIVSLSNCSRLMLLALYGNQFRGMLPYSIVNLSTTLTQFMVGANEFSGTIPPEISNLVKLYALGLEFNELTGTIPSTLGQIKDLQALALLGNNLHGRIPTTLGNLTKLTKLWLGFNTLQGNIPSSLGNCQNLILLNISNNKLSGIVPPQILGILTLSIGLDLSNNLLTGMLPAEVGNLKNLVRLDVSRNQFSDKLPATLSFCTSMEFIDMHDNCFNGSIPPSLTSLQSIKGIDLSCNNLSGQIPKFLQNLSFLEFLNLSYNHFEGEVPTKGVFSNTTRISLSGNGKLCGGLDELYLPSCHTEGSRKPTVALLIKVIVPVLVPCLILSACFIIFYAKRAKYASKSSRMLQIEEQFPMVSYIQLSKATNEFSLSNIIGQGSYGSVYKGVLGENGILVAVKVLNLIRKGAFKSFVAECEAIRNTRHRNLIKIITICSGIDFKGNDFKAIVYGYMQNGNLEEWLHSSNDPVKVSNLSLIQRLNIAIDVASAVEYLHHHCQPPIVHGDLKPSNILLDQDMVGHVGDFGLAKFISPLQLVTPAENPSSSIGIKGTVGYIAPEYGMGSEASREGDAYSFGIILLEMFTRRRPTDSMFNEGHTLHGFGKMALPEKVMEIVDPSLLLELRAYNFRSHHHGGDEGRVKMEECFNAIITIGVACSTESPTERIEMRDAVAKLRSAKETFTGMIV